MVYVINYSDLWNGLAKVTSAISDIIYVQVLKNIGSSYEEGGFSHKYIRPAKLNRLEKIIYGVEDVN